MMPRLILAFAFIPAAWAQLQLFHFDGATDTPVGNLYDAGTAATCDKLVVRFHIRNTGPQGVSVFINVAGAGFTFSVNGLNPSIIPPFHGLIDELEFDVSFTPTAAAFVDYLFPGRPGQPPAWTPQESVLSDTN